MSDSLLEFPCDFPLKVMGHSGPVFEGAVIGILRRHVPDLSEGAITLRPSRGGKYCALSVVIRAVSREQLDAIYRELTSCDQVVMAL